MAALETHGMFLFFCHLTFSEMLYEVTGHNSGVRHLLSSRGTKKHNNTKGKQKVPCSPTATSTMLVWLSEGERILGGCSVRGAAGREAAVETRVKRGKHVHTHALTHRVETQQGFQVLQQHIKHPPLLCYCCFCHFSF